jgi:hypothetical protein
MGIMSKKLYLALAGLLLVLTGCSSPDDATPSACAKGMAKTDAQGLVHGYPAEPVTDISGSRSNCVERIEFTVDGTHVPDIQAQYVPGIYQDTAGNSITVQGSAVLQVFVKVTMNPKIMSAPKTYDQEDGWSAVREVHYVGASGEESKFAIGLADKRPYWFDYDIDLENNRTTVTVAFVSSRQ